MAFLFDTDAISELLRPKPHPGYLKWVKAIPREDQFTSAVCVGELFKGAFRSSAQDRHLENIEERVLPAVTVLPFDIAATAIYHGLELVTGNVRHFQRIPQLKLNLSLANARVASE